MVDRLCLLPFFGEPVATPNFSSSRLLRWTLPALTLWAALATVGCSDAQQGAVQTPPPVVQSAQSPATAGTQEAKPQLAKRQGPEPFADCPQFFAKGQSPIVAPQPLQRPLC